MSLKRNSVRHTKARQLRALMINQWATNNESSAAAAPARSRMSSPRGTAGESCAPSIDSMPKPVLDSSTCQSQSPAREPKTDAGQPETKSSPAEQPSRIPAWKKNPANVRAVERQFKMLKCIQSEFVHSLEFLEPHESRLLGSYKFLPLVINDRSKWLVKKEDSILSLPTESVQDLKNRCQAAIEAGFMLLYEQLEGVQLATDEFAASQQKQKLLVQLKCLLSRQMETIVENIDMVCGATLGQQDAFRQHLYGEINKLRQQKELTEAQILRVTKSHSEQMNRLQLELEDKLKAQQQMLEEQQQEKLKEPQQRAQEAQRDEYESQLKILNASLKSKNSTIESVVAESNKQMALNAHLEQLLAKATAELLDTRIDLENSKELIALLERDLKEEREYPATVRAAKPQQPKDMPLSECNISVQQMLSDLEHVKTQLYKRQELVGELRAKSKSDQQKIASYTEEIKSYRRKAREHQDAYRKTVLKSADKEGQLNQMRLQLDLKEQQLAYGYEKMIKHEQQIRRLERFKKASVKESARIAMERDKQQEAKREGQHKNEKLTQELQQFVDFILYKGKAPAVLEGLIGVCSICSCIHQKNLDPQTRKEIQAKIGASHGISFSRCCAANTVNRSSSSTSEHA
ncbi:WD repeat-containing protein 87-like [Drosophila madeirensis]|uniref:WD repeat-containing protein 87-like n=1 Tax=Drosophila madeirensis TaxID=30013 RepID=A0AAU9G1Y6_DROMD